MSASVDSAGRVTLAVLAGGEGRRMGGPKGQLLLDGRPILRRLHERLAWPGPTLLVTAPGREHPPGAEVFDAEAVDPVAGEGPLRGVLTAVETAATPAVVIVPADMPDVSAAMLAWLARRLDELPGAAAVMIERRDPAGRVQLEPLPAAFRTGPAAVLVRRQLADQQLALHALARLTEVVVEQCPDDCPDDFWTNLNVADDVAAWHAASDRSTTPGEVR